MAEISPYSSHGGDEQVTKVYCFFYAESDISVLKNCLHTKLNRRRVRKYSGSFSFFHFFHFFMMGLLVCMFFKLNLICGRGREEEANNGYKVEWDFQLRQDCFGQFFFL